MILKKKKKPRIGRKSYNGAISFSAVLNELKVVTNTKAICFRLLFKHKDKTKIMKTYELMWDIQVTSSTISTSTLQTYT